MITMKDLYVRNPRCCECGATSPRWASINLGVLFCMDCSGIHRQMGTHISKVKSCTLDHWQQDWLQLIYNVGNDISNAYYEYSLPQEYMIDSKSLKHYVVNRMREKIFNKYDKRKWIPPFTEGPVELYLKGRVITDCLPQSENSNHNVKAAAAPVVVPKPSKPVVEVNQKTGTNTAPAPAAERKQNNKVNLLDCPTIDQVNTAKTIAAVEDVKRASVEPDIMGFSQPTYPSVPLANHTYDKLNDLLNDLEASPPSNHHQKQRVTVPLVKTSTASNKSKPKDPFLSLLD